MLTIAHLIRVADAYKLATGIERDQTVSYRVFRDSKKLSALRDGSDLHTTRFNDALRWFDQNWPPGARKPPVLRALSKSGKAA